jgi:hypothetical protein
VGTRALPGIEAHVAERVLGRDALVFKALATGIVSFSRWRCRFAATDHTQTFLSDRLVSKWGYENLETG